jgi:hypothetical protein
MEQKSLSGSERQKDKSMGLAGRVVWNVPEKLYLGTVRHICSGIWHLTVIARYGLEILDMSTVATFLRRLATMHRYNDYDGIFVIVELDKAWGHFQDLTM